MKVLQESRKRGLRRSIFFIFPVHYCVLLALLFSCVPPLQRLSAQVVPLTSKTAEVGDIATNQKFGSNIFTGGERNIFFKGNGRRINGVGLRSGAGRFRLKNDRFVRSITVSAQSEGALTLWDQNEGGREGKKTWELQAGETSELFTGFSERSRWIKIAGEGIFTIHAITLSVNVPVPPTQVPTSTPVVTSTPLDIPTAVPTSVPSIPPEVSATPSPPATPSSPPPSVCPSFPIYGFGSATTGGCGGETYVVTTLEDAIPPLPGMLRYGALASGVRNIVFATSGTINLKKDLIIFSGDLTIDGSDAPGEGIQLSGGSLIIHASNVIVRNVRVLVGPNVVKPGQADGIRISGDKGSYVERVVLDHCTVLWGIDENLSITDLAKDVTVQWSIIAEGLVNSTHPEGAHSMGILLHQDATRMTFHHNLIAHHNYRSPQLASRGVVEWINNVVYNTRSAAGIVQTALVGDRNYLDAIGNYTKIGPNFDTTTSAYRYSWRDGIVAGESRIFLKGNRDWNRTDDSMSEHLVAAPALRKWLVGERLVPDSNVPFTSAEEAYSAVLNGAGARGACRGPSERRLVAEVASGTGGFIDSPDERGGVPTLSSVCP